MPAVVIFLIFAICLIIAIPVSISLSVASVLPGAFDSSFTASGIYVIRSMLGGLDSFPLLVVPMSVLSGIIMARGGISRKFRKSWWNPFGPTRQSSLSWRPPLPFPEY